MKDTFKKLGKEALNQAKTEVVNSKSHSENVSSKIGKVALGTGNILDFIDINQVDTLAKNLLGDNERVFYYLASATDEVIFTNIGIIFSSKESLTSPKTKLNRYDFKWSNISNITLESAGNMDRDAELFVTIENQTLEWNINKKQMNLIINLYNSLINVERMQKSHALNTNIVNQSVQAAVKSIGRAEYPATTVTENFEAMYSVIDEKLSAVHIIDFAKAYVM